MYELHVDFDREWFASLANCSESPLDRPLFSNDSELKSPLGPYFVVPIFCTGKYLGLLGFCPRESIV